MESFFQSTLTDLVKAMRSTNLSEAAFLDSAFIDCKREIRSTDPHIKATALQKGTYISMLQGADMSWASFHCLEVMSQTRFWHKQAGYLAMANSFTGHSDLLLLATNLFRKDLASSNEYEAAQALGALSRVLTPSLARDLLPDVCRALSSSRLAVRKRAVLVLHHFFRADANAAQQAALKPLVSKLQDSETAVVCCAVNVLCELVCSSPTPAMYLPLAPPLFALLTQCTNTWLVIKLVKLFGVLAPLEPRLAAKLAAPLVAIIRSTPAKSLAYECVCTATIALPHDPELMALCAEKLREFIEDQDPNLRYLGLLALVRLLPVQTAVVSSHRTTALACLTDDDPTIQQVALRLVRGLVTSPEEASDVSETMLRLLREGALDPDFQHQLIAALLELNSRHRYALVGDFAWYTGVLVSLAQGAGSPHGGAVAAQLFDIALRVPDARPDLVHHLRDLLLAPALLLGGPAHPTAAASLGAAVWITGEYAAHVRDVRSVLEALLQPNVTLLPPDVQAIYVQAIFKVLVHALFVHPARPDYPVGASYTAPPPPSTPAVPAPGTPPRQEAVPSTPSKLEESPVCLTTGDDPFPPSNSVTDKAASSKLRSSEHLSSTSQSLLDTEPANADVAAISRHEGSQLELASSNRHHSDTTPLAGPPGSALSDALSEQSPSADVTSSSHHLSDTLTSAAVPTGASHSVVTPAVVPVDTSHSNVTSAAVPASAPHSTVTSAAAPVSASHSNLVPLVRTHLGPLLESRHCGVQERAVTLVALLDLLPTCDGARALRLAAASGAEELQPLAENAQSLVRAPEDLRLETSLEALAGLVSKKEPSDWGPEARAPEDAAASSAGRVDDHVASEEARAVREAHRQRYGQYYLPSEKQRPVGDTGEEDTGIADPPAPVARRKPARAVVKLDEELPPGVTRWMSGEGLQSIGSLKKGVLEQNVADLLTQRDDTVSADSTEEEKARHRKSKTREGRRRTEETKKESSKSDRHHKTRKKRPPEGDAQVDEHVLGSSTAAGSR